MLARYRARVMALPILFGVPLAPLHVLGSRPVPTAERARATCPMIPIRPTGSGPNAGSRPSLDDVNYAVSVTPHGGSANWPHNTSNHTYTFTVQNTGQCQDTWTMAASGTGTVSGASANPTSVTLAANNQQNVTVTYNVGAEGTGVLGLTATGFSHDSGWVNVTATLAADSVTPKGGTTATRTANTGPYSETFTIYNTGNVQLTLNLTCAGSSNVTCTGSPNPNPPSVTLNPGGSTTATASYNVGAAGTGTLSLTAAGGGVSDAGSYNVPVVSYGVTVTPKGTTTTPVLLNTGGYSQSFTVTNTGSASNTYTIACGGSSNVTCTSTSRSSLTLGSGADSGVTAYYNVGAVGTGTLSLSASGTNASDGGTYSVPVVDSIPQAPAVDVTSVNNGGLIERSVCLTIAAGSDAASECGDLRVVHPLPTTRTQNKARTPTLLYNTQVAHPYPLVAANVTLSASTQLPDSITGTLTINSVVRAHTAWATGGWIPGATRRVVLGYDGLNDATGEYGYTLEIRNWYPSTSLPTTVTGQLAVVNRSGSGFGVGWWLAGLEQLNVGTMLWTGGDGSVRQYQSAGSNVWAAPAMDRPDTLRWIPTTSNYVRYLPHGLRVLFDATGKHVATINRTQDTTAFAYDGCGRLSAITLPRTTYGLSYQFTYVSSTNCTTTLASITAPPLPTASRVTTLSLYGGLVTAITDPNGTSVGFGYDATFGNRINAREDRRTNTTYYRFDAGAKLILDSLPMDSSHTPIVDHIRPVESLGLATAVDTAGAYTQLQGPRTDVTDTTDFWLNTYGAPRRIVNALGGQTVITRGDGRWPALATQLQAPNGFTTRASYDARGNVDTLTQVNPLGDGRNAVTTYTWDPVWDFVAGVTLPTGEVTSFAYDGGTGNRLFQQPGTDPSRQVQFFYNSVNLLRATLLPGTPTARDSIAYDALGNVLFTQTPLGFTTYTDRDNVGRDTLVISPVDAAGQYSAMQKKWYDLADQDTLTISSSTQAIDYAEVRTHYDPEGNADSVLTISAPDRNSIGRITRAFLYDHANRKTGEILVGVNTIPFRYDPAGNLTNGGRQGADGVAVTYDVLNRAILRKGSDSAAFTYDAVGNLLTANNYYARISRTYNPNGTVSTDTLRIATIHWWDADFTHHIYGLRFGYDLSGRRAWFTHPSQLVSNSGDSVAYAYDPVFGALNTVRDIFGHVHRYAYDLAGRPVQLTQLSGETDSAYTTFAYDPDSRRTRRNGPVVSDSIQYDARGNALEDVLSGEIASYSALGPILSIQGNAVPETFNLDALGNRLEDLISGTPGVHDYYAYQPGSGRLVKQWILGYDTTTDWYDLPGELTQSNHFHYFPWNGSGWQWELRQTNNQYNNEQQLVWSGFTLDSNFAGNPPPGYHPYNSNDTFRYDALGRRIFDWEYRGANCSTHDATSGCLTTLTRIVWDGDQILYEMRGPGDTTYGVSSIEADDPNYDNWHGYLGYLHGPGIDRPLALWKVGEQVLVLPFTNWREAYIAGWCNASACTGDQVWFPAASGQAFGEPPWYPNGPPNWHGSLVEGGQDASGYQYRRNRYYDPNTGRFTQEDPLGLAGGVNVYGFANGDPVNFSDPFGLCPPQDNVPCRDVTPEEGREILHAAAETGQWTWTEGRPGQPPKDVAHHVGDCADFCETGQEDARLPALDPRPSTRDFDGSSDFRALAPGEKPQMGDMVVAGGHAGISTGQVDEQGRPRALQNGQHGTRVIAFDKDAAIYRREVPN